MTIQIFENIIKAIINNPWIILLIMMGTPVGIIITVILYRKNINRVSIKFSYQNYCLIEAFKQKINGLNIKYLNNNIETLNVTRYIFWNNGNEAIRCTDIPTNDNFFIEINDNDLILDATILNVSNPSNNISINLSDNNKRIFINFDYLDKQDGFILQIFHNSSSVNPFYINGSIIGFGKITKGFSIIETPLIIFISKFINKKHHLLFKVIFIFILSSISIILNFYNNNAILYFMISLLLYNIFDSKLLSIKIPKILYKHYTDFSF